MEGADRHGLESGPDNLPGDDYEDEEDAEYGVGADDYEDELDEEGFREEHYLEQRTEWDRAAEDQEAEEDGDGDEEEDEEDEDEEADEDEDEDDQDDIFDGQIDPMSLLDDMEQAGGERDGARSIELMQQARLNIVGEMDWEGSSQRPLSVAAKRPRGRPKGSKNKRSKVFGASMDEIYESAALSAGSQRGRKKRKRRKARASKESSIPKEILEMMSQATADYALGRHKAAATILKEVIRREPNYRDAYRVMGLLNEDLGNKKRALAFFMLEAHLSKKDVDPWRRVSRLSMELGLRRQSVYCLNHVIRRAKDDLGARYDKAVLLNELGEPGKAVVELEKLQKVSSGNPDVPRDLARLYHSMNKPRKAMEALERHLGQFPHKSNLTHVNMLCELYMDTNKLAEAKALIENAQAVLCADSGGNLPIDLQVKLGICCFRLGEKVEASQHLQPLFEVDDCPDLILVVANMYREGRDFNSALQFFELLLDGRQNMTPDVLRDISECYKELGQIEEPVKLYEVAIADMQPNDKHMLECLLQLCELKIELGDKAAAHRLVAQAMKEGTDAAADPDGASGKAAELQMWLSRMYLRLGDRERFLQTVLPPMYATLNYLENRTAQLLDVETPQGVPRRLKLILTRRQKLREKGQLGGDGGLFTPAYRVKDRRQTHLKAMEQKYSGVIEELEKMEQDFKPSEAGARAPIIFDLLNKDGRSFLLLLQAISALLENGDPESIEDAHELAKQCMRVLKFDHSNFFLRDNLRLTLTEVKCRLPAMPPLWYEFRYVMRRWPSSMRVLNAYSQILCRSGGHMRITRSVTSMRSQFPTSVPLMMLTGNMYAMISAMPEAINEYVHAYHAAPKEPLVCLCLAVSILRDGMAFRAQGRHRSIVQAMGFFCEYRRLRKDKPQEAAYNIGRALQELGLFHLAIPFYEEALVCRQDSEGSASDPLDPSDLTREAAHNLVLIYQASGATGLAQATMRKYLVI